MEHAFQGKYTKYQALINVITGLGYRCRFCVLIFGSLGHVYKSTVSGLKIAGMTMRKAKQIARYCSVSAVIGSLAVWRKRCHLYP